MKLQSKQIIKIIKPILQNAGVYNAALFGSYANNTATQNSDVDIIVQMPSTADLLDLVRLKANLEYRLKKPVDLTTYRSLLPAIKTIVAKELIKII